MDSLPNRPQPSRPLGELIQAWLHWFGVVRLLVCSLAVVAVGAGGFWLLKAPPTAVEATLPYASQSTAAATTMSPSVSAVTTTVSTTPAFIVVHVAGAVAAPGVYTIAATSRLYQALEAAGEMTAEADRDALNLASQLRDGDRIFVPRLGQQTPTVVSPQGGGGAVAGAAAVTGPIDLNRATVAELDALPGVGPATAAAIVAYRDQHGPFGKVDDLLRVRGIGPAKLEAMAGLVAT